MLAHGPRLGRAVAPRLPRRRSAAAAPPITLLAWHQGDATPAGQPLPATHRCTPCMAPLPPTRPCSVAEMSLPRDYPGTRVTRASDVVMVAAVVAPGRGRRARGLGGGLRQWAAAPTPSAPASPLALAHLLLACTQRCHLPVRRDSRGRAGLWAGARSLHQVGTAGAACQGRWPDRGGRLPLPAAPAKRARELHTP